MKQFALLETTQVKIINVNPRREKHGARRVPAIDVKLELTVANVFVDSLVPGLRESLCEPVDGPDDGAPQGELDGVDAPTPTPRVRYPQLDPISLHDEFTGYVVTFDIGLGQPESLVALGGAKISGVTIEFLQGGTSIITYTVKASGISAEQFGRLCILIDAMVGVRQVPPAEGDEDEDPYETRSTIAAGR